MTDEKTIVPEPSGTVSTGTAAAVTPTLGATVGSALGTLLAGLLPKPLDPLLSGTVITVTTAAVTAAFHWLGLKLSALAAKA
jgi:hypothetical protein